MDGIVKRHKRLLDFTKGVIPFIYEIGFSYVWEWFEAKNFYFFSVELSIEHNKYD